MRKPKGYKFMSEYWLKHYSAPGHCVLCGNTGVIDTTGRAITPAGLHVGGKHYCICPNGFLLGHARNFEEIK